MALESPNEFIVLDTFFVEGRGFVFCTTLPEEYEGKISVYNELVFDNHEKYTVIAIERARSSIGLSRNIGMLIRGDLKQDKSFYYKKKFKII
ncbi:hypothetical protein [Paenibacillus elgii]|uniref:hypothetical protein n=1 Tax=Paenibacillus elgii TaxID=189691 RepID=UPI00203C640E|nr:hypothetical protein [Paenibacillus elgii]MCM3268617.1 hypothetical protein [Paenibacillus elgii]